MTSTHWCHPDRSSACVIVLVLISWCCQCVDGACRIKPTQESFHFRGYVSQNISYNVCVDSTRITSQLPSTSRPSFTDHYFRRACCGCRVSRAGERQFYMEKIATPRELELFYFIDIQACECINCHTDQFETGYLRYLKHKRR